jgi:hypothetical protein
MTRPTSLDSQPSAVFETSCKRTDVDGPSRRTCADFMVSYSRERDARRRFPRPAPLRRPSPDGAAIRALPNECLDGTYAENVEPTG